MPLLKLTNAQLAFGHHKLLDFADLQLDPAERVALIGRNGTGKSSLLSALAGAIDLDDGEVWLQPGARIAYLAQEPNLDLSVDVFSNVVAGFGEVATYLKQYHHISLQLSNQLLSEEIQHNLLQQMEELQHEIESRQLWHWESLVLRAISRVGLTADGETDKLSGGQKKRLAIAQALVTEPDVILLDEPTNHLDIEAIIWLETMLIESATALLFITHDRQFLDAVATRIIELDRGKLQSFPGSYSVYQSRKELLLHEETLANARFDKLLKEEEIWIRKGVEARRTRAVFRVQRLDKLRLERAERRDRMGKVKLSVHRGDQGGQIVAELKHVKKKFADQVIIKDLSLRIQRGDKIGLVGVNGAGKTTLLKIILGQLAADSGEVKLGTRLEIAYFDQFRSQLDPEMRLVDVISPGSDYVEIGNSRKHVIGYLEDFLFAPERARSPVKSLSGGERNRLLLARLFAKSTNVLVLDEPTNDLDIETLELLEQLLQDYNGTVFLVSHDRVFLDQVVTQCIVAEGNGVWQEYVGGYSDWKNYQQKISVDAIKSNNETSKAKTEVNYNSVPQNLFDSKTTKKKKLNNKQQLELNKIPDQISKLESRQAEISNKLQQAEVYNKLVDGTIPATALTQELNEINISLEQLLLRWEELENQS